ncbi:hypothetical protein BKG94_07720 [Rodentibacter ratti]|uniref:DUF3800 domain-containing protein n=1 Tax=Rodentibacter ratti TaxID=1906745 RepID=UPI000987BCA8|nr:DUF3800 domain-containing protein [Rodentibacter ratti]OOF88179.1 hypothetical protein BKG94_07720 [Rodentibacter ratti]
MNFNIYCDESCHLPNDKISVMVLGAIRCPVEKTKEIAKRLREIKIKHGFHPNFEIKWNKISKAKASFYLDIVDYFFDDDDLSFRGIIIDKSNLNHKSYNQTHDEWYYKMMFLLLKNLLIPKANSFIYLDKKDTQSAIKVKKLHDILCHSTYDFEQRFIKRVQVVESHHVEQLQLADLLLGALGYYHRNLSSNEGKKRVINRIKERSGYALNKNTLPAESKFNLFHWEGNYYG